MSGWILIITLIGHVGDGGGVSVAMQEFSTLEHCQHAAEKWKKSVPKGNYRNTSAICVPK